MKLNFLCQHHRSWLMQHPDIAATSWLKHHDEAVGLVEEANYKRATAYAGCALEAADITMDNRPTMTPSLIDNYTRTNLLLVQLLSRGSHAGVAKTVVDRAIARMESLLVTGVDKDSVLRSCDALLQLGQELEKRFGPHTGFATVAAQQAARVLH